MKTQFSIALLLASCAAFANDSYSTRISGTHTSITHNSGYDLKSNLITARHYLKPVQANENQPYAEAPFLQRASSITGSIGKESSDTNTTETNNYTQKMLGTTIYQGNYILDVFVQNSERNTRLKSNSSLGYDTKTLNGQLSVGYFVQENTTLSYVHSKSTVDSSLVGGVMNLSDWSTSSNGLSVRSVIGLSSGYFVALSGGYKKINVSSVTNSNNNEYEGAVRFYPNTRSYLEYQYVNRDGDNNGSTGNTHRASAGIELNKYWDIHISGAKLHYDDGSKTKFWNLGAGYRF